MKLVLRLSLCLICVTFLGCNLSNAQSQGDELSALQKEVKDLKKQIEAIQQIPQIQQLLALNAPLDVDLDVSNAPFKGNKDAPITIVEFSDYECPACKQFAQLRLPALEKSLIDSGQAKLVFFDFPLQRHTKARKAAAAASCAGEQGKYWEMHDELFANQTRLNVADLMTHGETLALDMEAYTTCLDSDKYEAEITAEMELGQLTGLRGTPHFVMGKTTKNGDGAQITRKVQNQNFVEVMRQINEEEASPED